MPRHGIKNSNAASIEITDFQSTYLPGSVVLGHVVTKLSFAEVSKADQTSVNLKLFGRAKTKIVDKSGQVTVIYRGRAGFAEEQECIFRGPVTAGARIPFAITVPQAAQPGFEKRGDSWDRDRSDNWGIMPGSQSSQAIRRYYLCNTQDDVTKQTLPGVFYFRDKSQWSGNIYEAFIEYVLEATMTCPGTKDVVATFPLLIRTPSTQKPLAEADHEFIVRDSFKTIRSERLIAQNSDKKLTLRDRSKMFFKLSKVPRYSYKVKIIFPQVIQLEHPDPLSLKIYVVPILDQVQTTVCPDGDVRRLPAVEFVSLELDLVSLTRLRCEGSLPGRPHGKDREETLSVPFRYSFEPFTFKVPVIIRGNLNPQESAGIGYRNDYRDGDLDAVLGSPYIDPGALRPLEDGTPVPQGPIPYTSFHADDAGAYFLGSPFDLGSHLDIRLSQFASSTMGHTRVPFGKPVWPSFTTYNIVRAYELSWRVKLTCAGESHTVAGRGNVTVLPPSEEQEVRKKRELGKDGMQRNHDDLMGALELAWTGFETGLDVLQAITGT
ncbi:hypothetical protein BKA67DRAFT_583041 [Truncatella angustata]|uniref:Arrestin-like N-terminal domain-containing protein n=1 Tax=Truncatella angustata TaxID=152316 RepID=A0A9P8UCN6_9PEZI|nr:uncharacterized protein BKA67DRAFT_583041 [Truncatella angustata]KAH6646042.1 hypothetical protein BKA67DRAFT_583041 [Truncatella angustata]